MNYLAAPALVAGLYHLIALIAGLGRGLSARSRARDQHESPSYPPVSILKPVRGRGPGFYEAIRSHALIDYPQFEILFGVHQPDDPASEDVARLAAEFPERAIRLVVCPRKLPNRKVGVLADLARAARYPVLVVNDGDILVERDYLRAHGTDGRLFEKSFSARNPTHITFCLSVSAIPIFSSVALFRVPVTFRPSACWYFLRLARVSAFSLFVCSPV